MHLSQNIIPLVLLAAVLSAASINVSNADALESAVESASPGDSIIVLPGVYDTGGSMTMTAGGTAESPVLITAQTIGTVQLTGESYFDLRQVAYVTIRGFIFTSTDVTAIKTQACHHVRISQNVFRLGETESRKWVYIGGVWNDANAPSHHNRIDHNLFEEKHLPGNFITIDGQADPVYQSSQYDRIDHNHFRNIGPRVENEMEAVRVGWSEMSMSSGFTTVEYNLFEDCDGDPEIISVKTCDDTVRYNTFRHSQGTLSLRHGNRSRVEGNFFFGEGKAGSGGVRVYGDDHVIVNNYFHGLLGTTWDAPITLTNGDYDSGTSYSRHFRINRALVLNNTLVGNTHSIEIGFTNNGSYDRPPRDVTMKNNLVVGSAADLIIIYTQPVNMVWMTNLMYPQDGGSVGLNLPSNQILVVDPQLELVDDLYRLESGSPAINHGTPTTAISIDMDGQPRSVPSDIGADEYSTLPILRSPLTGSDVGPDALLPVSTRNAVLNPENFKINVVQYPNPFNSQTRIRVDGLSDAPTSLHLLDIRGRYLAELWTGSPRNGSLVLKLDLRDRASGEYLLLLRTPEGQTVKKIQLLK